MNGSSWPRTTRHPFANHLTVLLLVLVLALVGCQDNAPLAKRVGKPQLGQKFVTYTFSLPDVAKIKARNPKENFTLTQMKFTATSRREGCAAEEQTVPFSPDSATIAVDLRPGCDYQVKIDGVGQQLAGTPAPPSEDEADETPAPGGTTITYQQVIAPLMQKHCTSCHVEQGPMQAYPLSKADQVRARIESIIERVELENMPPRGPFFSDNQIAQLRAWRDQGFALTGSLKLDGDSLKLLCTSREFTFRATAKATNAANVTPDFVWYFEKSF